jgi:hypothetical protein
MFCTNPLPAPPVPVTKPRDPMNPQSSSQSSEGDSRHFVPVCQDWIRRSGVHVPAEASASLTH